VKPTTSAEEVVWVGLDVHKESVSVGVAIGGQEPQLVTTVRNRPVDLTRVLRRLEEKGQVQVVYEAGPCGYEIYRLCQKLGIDCMVAAPSLIPRKPGERVKTDKRDAIKLCRLLRSGDLTPVWVPDAIHEALRDLVRAREDALEDRQRIRHRIKKLLLRQGQRPPEKMRSWSRQYRKWLGEVGFEDVNQRMVWQEYLGSLDELEARLKRYAAALQEAARASPQVELIGALQMLKGIAELTALTIVTEVGDLSRFPRPSRLFSYSGMVPAEYSSGEKVRHGSITKAGNAHLRRVLVEASWAYRYPPAFKGRLAARKKGQPQWLVDISFRAQERLHLRYRALARRGKPAPVALTAVARELLGYIWEVATELKQRRTLEVAA
jgi:transposase